jgi:uncharacterized protein DUF6252
MLRLRSLIAPALVGALLAACSGDTTGPSNSNTSGNNNGNNNGGNSTGTRMTATIDGQSWSAATATGGVVALQFSPRSGGYTIIGTQLSSTGTLTGTITLTVNNISGPGTYPLGVDAVSVYGGFAGITSTPGGTWITPISGAAGTVTITALTATRIAGTFSFNATPSSGGATGTRVVTNGVFDAPFSGSVTIPSTLPDSVGGKMSATLNGTAWNAAIVSAGTSLGYISLSGINDRQTLIFTLPQPAAAGTYQLSNNAGFILKAWDPNAVAPAGARCCWGVVGDIGTITFTSLTKTRAKGTITATLSPQPGTAATGQLVIANLTFDLGLFHNP